MNPYCALKGDGCGLLASVVDHKIPHRGDERIFWDRTNWQPLCKHCHDVHKQRIEAGYAEVKRDHRGRLVI